MPRTIVLIALLAACSAPEPIALRPTAPVLADLPLHQLELYGYERLAQSSSWSSDSDSLELSPAGAAFPATGGRAVSRALRYTEPFQSVLPSWNAVVPSGAGFCVEVQVAADDEHWSPWLYLGDWGLGRPETQRTLESPAGRVAVDVLKLAQPATRLRWRAIGMGGAGQVQLTNFALALEGTDSRTDHNPPNDRGPALDLELPARSQRMAEASIAARICSPTSVAMVLAHFGHEESTEHVAAVLYDPINDIYGNWNRAVQGAYQLGVVGHLERFSNWHHVRATLDEGRPLVISIGAKPGELQGAPYQETGGHLLAISGLDGQGGVICRDPAADAPAGVARIYSCADLEHVWMRRGGVAYVFGDPPITVTEETQDPQGTQGPQDPQDPVHEE
ncbi:MAG: hypothetical protein ACI8QC_003246 [Planctomycetota bacterium]|jgi:hypothetical protein